MKRRAPQLELTFPRRGGRRRGAGRKRVAARPRVPHRPRDVLAARHPVLVTVRVRGGLPSLRGVRSCRVLERCLAAAADRFGVRLVEYSIQSNHLHLIVEAQDERALARGMKGLLVRSARRLNALWGRRGALVDDHYHARALRSPREVRNALVYVLQNARKHGGHLAGPDPCSSGPWFDGWSAGPSVGPAGPAGTVRARTWLLSIGWRRHGRISIDEVPASA